LANEEGLVSKQRKASRRRIDFSSVLVFDVEYQRDVDKRTYRIARPVELSRASKTGKALLWDLRRHGLDRFSVFEQMIKHIETQ
jgi:hypothetical protein